VQKEDGRPQGAPLPIRTAPVPTIYDIVSGIPYYRRDGGGGWMWSGPLRASVLYPSVFIQTFGMLSRYKNPPSPQLAAIKRVDSVEGGI